MKDLCKILSETIYEKIKEAMEAEEQTSKFKLKLGLIDVHLNLKDETEAKIAERS